MLDGGAEYGVGAPLSNDQYGLAMEYLLGQAARAKVDVVAFHEFVHRDEVTQRRITTRPFQRLIFEFLERYTHCVLMLPPGYTKTTCVMSRTLWRIGNDPTRRCMFISKDQEKSAKSVTTLKTIVEESNELRLVFPELRPNERKGEPWTQEKWTVHRPLGIKDPTCSAGSIEKGIAGYRLSDLIIDDTLDEKNTRTQAERNKMWELHEKVLLHRLDQGVKADDTRMIVMNTAWDQDDYLHRLMDDDEEKWGKGWPALQIDVYGNVYLRNIPASEWDPPELRPAKCNQNQEGQCINPEGPFRISEEDDAYSIATGDDPDNAPLWWQKYTHAAIQKIRGNMTEVAFNQTYLNKCRTEETARCKLEWIKACLKKGKDSGHVSMVAATKLNPYVTRNPVVMGVDLAFGVGEENDCSSIATWEFLESGEMKLLDIYTAQMANATFIRDIVYEKAIAYGDCHVVVETVGAQKMMKDILSEKDAALKVRSFNTSGAGAMNKWDRVTGVESLFVQVMNAAWILPCPANGRVHPEVQKLINACIYYRPTLHTPDELMACWFAIWWGRRLHQWRKMEGEKGGGGLLGISSR